MSTFFCLVKMDAYRFRGRFSIFELLYLYFFEYGFRIVFYYRVAQIPCLSILGKVLLKRSAKFGVTISSRAKIGGGLYLCHAHNICISQHASIGINANLSQGVTVGSNSNIGAVIGDYVYIGANSVVVGDVSIANRVIIGAGSIVVRSCNIASGIYVGNPATFIKINDKYNYHPFFL